MTGREGQTKTHTQKEVEREKKNVMIYYRVSKLTSAKHYYVTYLTRQLDFKNNVKYIVYNTIHEMSRRIHGVQINVLPCCKLVMKPK